MRMKIYLFLIAIIFAGNSYAACTANTAGLCLTGCAIGQWCDAGSAELCRRNISSEYFTGVGAGEDGYSCPKASVPTSCSQIISTAGVQGSSTSLCSDPTSPFTTFTCSTLTANCYLETQLTVDSQNAGAKRCYSATNNFTHSTPGATITKIDPTFGGCKFKCESKYYFNGSECKLCEAGYACSGSTDFNTTTNQGRSPCTGNNYSAAGASACASCGTGACGSINTTACSTGSTPNTRCLCMAGYQCGSTCGNTRPTCTACVPGSANSGLSSSSCGWCIAPDFQSLAGKATCETCPGTGGSAPGGAGSNGTNGDGTCGSDRIPCGFTTCGKSRVCDLKGCIDLGFTISI